MDAEVHRVTHLPRVRPDADLQLAADGDAGRDPRGLCRSLEGGSRAVCRPDERRWTATRDVQEAGRSRGPRGGQEEGPLELLDLPDQYRRELQRRGGVQGPVPPRIVFRDQDNRWVA